MCFCSPLLSFAVLLCPCGCGCALVLSLGVTELLKLNLIVFFVMCACVLFYYKRSRESTFLFHLFLSWFALFLFLIVVTNCLMHHFASSAVFEGVWRFGRVNEPKDMAGRGQRQRSHLEGNVVKGECWKRYMLVVT